MTLTTLLSRLAAFLLPVLCFSGLFRKRTEPQKEVPTRPLAAHPPRLVCPRGDYSMDLPKYLPRTPLTCPNCGQRLIARY
jgi:hypothetical protein